MVSCPNVFDFILFFTSRSVDWEEIARTVSTEPLNVNIINRAIEESNGMKEPNVGGVECRTVICDTYNSARMDET